MLNDNTFFKQLAAGIIVSSAIYTATVQSKEVSLTLGIGTPILSQDAYSSNNTQWEAGNIIGSVIIATKCPYLTIFDCSVWHHSLILDTKDYGVTGATISYIFKFNL